MIVKENGGKNPTAEDNADLIPQNKVYGADDIEVVEVRRGERIVRNPRECYDCFVVVGGVRYVAKWYPSDKKYLSDKAICGGAQDLLVIYSNGRKNTVRISDDVIKAIEDKIDLSAKP